MANHNSKTFRLDLELEARLRERARQAGEPDSETIRNALDFYLDFEPEVFRWLSNLAEALHLPVALVAEGIIVRRMAELEAYRELHGHDDPAPAVEFPMTGAGLIRGEARFRMLIQHFVSQLAQDRTAQPRQSRGSAELTEDEKAAIAEARELQHRKTGRKLKTT